MLLSIILLVVTLLLVLFYPALRQSRAEAAEQDQVQKDENLRLYQERVADLEAMELSESEKAQMQLELDRELLAAVGDDTRFGDGPAKGPRLVFSLALLVVTLVSVAALYMFWGAGNEVRATQLLEYSTSAELTAEEYSELGQRLAQASERQPDNMEWAFLQGRLLEAEGDFAAAADAYDGLLARLSQDQVQDRAAIMTLAVQARFFANNQQPDEQLYQRLLAALELAPQQRKPLGLAGILAYELGDYRNAIGHWRSLWVQLPAGMEAMTIENGIRRAAEVLTEQGETVDLSWLVSAGIRVRVDISDEARAAVPAGATVFVLARALDGPPMPLAVQRLVVSQLPADILLDNSMAMTAGASLSSVEQVTVTARVSLSGQPMAQSGDWQVQQHNVPTRGAPQQMLTISEQID